MKKILFFVFVLAIASETAEDITLVFPRQDGALFSTKIVADSEGIIDTLTVNSEEQATVTVSFANKTIESEGKTMSREASVFIEVRKEFYERLFSNWEETDQTFENFKVQLNKFNGKPKEEKTFENFGKLFGFRMMHIDENLSQFAHAFSSLAYDESVAK